MDWFCALWQHFITCLQHLMYASKRVQPVNSSRRHTFHGGEGLHIPTLLNFCSERRKPLIYAPESRSAKVLI